MNFPINSLRGILNNDYIVEDGTVASNLFFFDDKYIRDNRWIEQSINWQDDENAISLTLNQKKEDGTYQFKAGVAILPRKEIDRLINKPNVKGKLSYERQPIENNPYHGNLLLLNEIPKRTMKMWAAVLAVGVSEIVHNKNEG